MSSGSRSTMMGIVALLVWSATIAVSRSLAEAVGSLRAGALMFGVAGLLGCARSALMGRKLGHLLRLSPAYLLGCGGLFVAYMVCLYGAIGLAADRQQTLEVGLINYLWPGLTLVFSVPLLGTRVRAPFFLGVVVALLGATLAPLGGADYSLDHLSENLLHHPAPYLLALGAAVTWALYSTLSRRWAADAEAGAVPLFALAAGAVLGLLHLAFPEPVQWTPRAVAELIYMAVFPSLIAYAFWDTAVRRGNLTLIASLAYAVPLASTLVSCLYLQVPLGWNLLLSCGLIMGGAWMCETSVARPAPQS